MMPVWIRICLLLGSVLAAIAVSDAAPAHIFSAELNTDLYDCTVTLRPTAKPVAGSTMQLSLEKQGQNYTLLSCTASAVAVIVVRDGKQRVVTRATYPARQAFPCQLLIQRRGGTLAVRCDGLSLFRGPVPRGPGNAGVIDVGRGWADPSVTVQRLEPVNFADDFMRTADEPGAWVVHSGAWGLQSAWDHDPKGNALRFANAGFSLHPFSWVGQAGTTPALCTTGFPFWEDYTLNVDVRPASDGAVGVAANLADAQHGYLVRWTPANAPGADGNRLMIGKLADGKFTPVAESRGGYLPGQWYRMTVVSNPDGLRVLIDNRERLLLKDPSPWRGGIGLYVEGKNSATFDDVTADGSLLKKDLLAENVLAHLNQRFEEDHKGMGQWAQSGIDWTTLDEQPPMNLYRWDCFGDHWLTLTAVRQGAGSGAMQLTLNGDEKGLSSGYHITIAVAAGTGKTRYTLTRNAEVLATRTGDPLSPGVEYDFRFWHVGQHLWLEQDGDTVLEAEGVAPLPGLRPLYRYIGSITVPHSALVLGRNVIDDTFAKAPVDWIGDGVWMTTSRWACSPQWSFLAGWDRGNAVLWSKQRVNGDQTFQAFVAPKMEYPREHQQYEDRYRDMSITICGDGHDPRSGYSGIFGAPDEQGQPNRRSVLLRNGQVVATSFLTMPNWMEGHIAWFDLVLKKRGAHIELWIGGQLAAAFTDPQPIDGGVPAIWTSDNGIVIARTRLHFANPLQPRTDALVSLDSPWYPEWADIDRPFTLGFAPASSAGLPVRLQVTAHDVPDGDAQSATVAKDSVLLQPTHLGHHWYQVTATDGTVTSPAVQLDLPVFKPALGRDDAHALVLYRFTEGSGTVVKDQSAILPHADLQITGKSAYAWYPQQGLHLMGPNRLITATGAKKLMAIAKTHAGTLECWISPDTIFPLTDWLGVILTWEQPNEVRNFGLAEQAFFWTFSPHGSFFGDRYGRALTAKGARNGLRHLVVTWDGQLTKLYVDGQLLRESSGSWEPESWEPDAPLILGNQPEGKQRSYLSEAQDLTGALESIINRMAIGQHCFLGTYYLVAIHDRCFSQPDVTRHYQAGPAAK